MSRNFSFSIDEFYHLYNRGTEKRKIFLSHSESERFVSLLYLCNSTEAIHRSDFSNTDLSQLLKTNRKGTLIDIAAYCLMPNHFHVLVREHTEGGISRFMQKLMTAYTMYFNKKYERNGTLFQGKFKAEHADEDVYLKYLIAYIHLNPIKLLDPTWRKEGLRNKRKAEKHLHTYKFSSFLDYAATERPESSILNKAALPEYFPTPGDFLNEMFEWLHYHEVNVKVEP